MQTIVPLALVGPLQHPRISAGQSGHCPSDDALPLPLTPAAQQAATPELLWPAVEARRPWEDATTTTQVQKVPRPCGLPVQQPVEGLYDSRSRVARLQPSQRECHVHTDDTTLDIHKLVLELPGQWARLSQRQAATIYTRHELWQ